jgi:NADPH-dependent 2,4-dienoyl-CoA reductase/sulfur reductase-like enzyme
MHLLIIGGSDAGVSAALRARELDAGVEVTMVVADDYPNFSICGLPYFLSGETPDWRDLAHRKEFPGINVLRRHVAKAIDASDKTVLIHSASGETILRYDRLVVATGAEPIRPKLPGSDLDGVFVLHSMDDSFAVNSYLADRAPQKAILIGAGYIGLEMADALTQRGLEVTLLSRSQTVLPTVDPALGRIVGEELTRHGVRVIARVSAQAVEYTSNHEDTRLSVVDSNGDRHLADLAILAVGVRPNSDLASRAGATLGINGAIAVTRHMSTNLPDIYAAGDCVETYHRLLGGRPTSLWERSLTSKVAWPAKTRLAATAASPEPSERKASKSLNWRWRGRDCSIMKPAAAASIL